MESMPVNWEALDALVVDFAKSERLIGDASASASSSSPPSSPPISPSSSPSSAASSSSSSYRSRLLIRLIRRAVEAGDIDAAIGLLRVHVPALLSDRRILFQLQKQKFVELMRRGSEKDRDSAINCLRVDLAPCALDAYPEAYEEFKHVLLALIFDKEDQNSPVTNEWSERKRYELAGRLSSILRAHLHAYDPILSMTLRYLISIHKMYCTRLGVSSPISDLTQRLLLEERDPVAIPLEGFYEAPPFDEVDIQALAHAVDLTRQGSVDSLKFAKGDLFQAFQNELCRMKLDLSMLDKLVHEYCIYRGIIDVDPDNPSDLLRSSSRDCSSNLVAGCRLPDGEIPANNFQNEGLSQPYCDVMKIRESDCETRSSSELTNNDEDCSTSDVKLHETTIRRLRKSRNYATCQRSRKRWRIRDENLECDPRCLMAETPKKDLKCHQHDECEDSTLEELDPKNHSLLENLKSTEDNKYEIILEIRELAYKGLAARVVDEINAIDPDFFPQNPGLLFQLKQIEFLASVNNSDLTNALKVASTHLGPLAASDQALLKPLKETLLFLLKPGGDALAKGTPLPVLATSLQVAVGRKLGIEEPQLVKIVRATLHTHNEWFKLQMCKDQFEKLLKIDHLKEIDAPIRGDTAFRTSDDCTNSSQITVNSSSKTPEDGGSPQISSSVSDESAILKVMEFLALPRADAIHLLMQYNGNAETVIQQLFS